MRRLKNAPPQTDSRPKEYARSAQRSGGEEAPAELLQKIEGLQKEVAFLREQRQDSLREIKRLENQLLVAREQSRKSLDDYAESVAQSFNADDLSLRKRKDFDYGRQAFSGAYDRPPSEHSYVLAAKEELFPGIRSSLNPELAALLTSPYLEAEPRRSFAAPPQPKPTGATDPGSSFVLPYPVQASTSSYLPQERFAAQAYPVYTSGVAPLPATADRVLQGAPAYEQNASRESRLRKRLSDSASKASYDQQYLSKLSGIYDRGQQQDAGAMRRMAVAQNRSSADAGGYKSESFLSDYTRRVLGEDSYSSKRW